MNQIASPRPTVSSHILTTLFRLPPARFRVRVTRNIPVPMSDGVRLFADLYQPRDEQDAPTILIRTPYGRFQESRFATGLTLAAVPARAFAERGYAVLVQSVRGSFGSEGTFDPHINEKPDGGDTVRWIQQQPWFNGRLGTWGPSYLGYTQWATAADQPHAIQAMVPAFTSAENFSVTHPNGAFGLETRLRWTQSVYTFNKMFRLRRRERLRRFLQRYGEAALQKAFKKLPLRNGDTVATGSPIPYYRALLDNPNANSPYWQRRNHRPAVTQTAAPAHFIGGWYDYYLPGLLRDYQAQVKAGLRPRLTIGAWHHTHPATLSTSIQEGLRWFDIHLRHKETRADQPVHLFVMKSGWRRFAVYPPPTEQRALFLRANGEMSKKQTGSYVSPTRYRYDPAHPTPAVGGALLSLRGAGAQDNRKLEARSDVRCFTDEPLAQPLEIIGEVTLTLFASSSRPFTDFFARLCDVSPNGRSRNVCDGFIRLDPQTAVPDKNGIWQLHISLGHTAHRFRIGHRLRLLVASGAHPRWSRNLGTGLPVGHGTEMIVADQCLFHDPRHPSRLHLPVYKS